MNHFTDFFKLPSRMGKGVIFCHFFPQEQMPELLFGRFLSKSYIKYEKKKCYWCEFIKERDILLILTLIAQICALDIVMF